MTPEHARATVAAFRDRAVGWAQGMGLSPSAAEDVAHDALLALLDKAPGIDAAFVGQWLRTTVLHGVRNHQRAAAKVSPMAPPERVEPAPDPEVTMASREMSAEVRAAVTRIPPSRRKIVVAVLGNETTIAAVAVEEAVPESTARRRLADGADDLRGVLERERERERRRSRGFTSWAAVWALMDVRWRRLSLAFGAVAAGGALLHFLVPHEAPVLLTEMPDERPAIAVEAAPFVPPFVPPSAPVERAAEPSRPVLVLVRTHHDAGQRFRAERFGAP